MDEQEINKSRKKWPRILIIIFVSVLSIVTLFAFVINRYWKPLLSNVIKNTIVNATDSLYHINFSDIQINIITGSVTVDNITFLPDTAVYRKMVMNNIAPENIVELKINRLTINNAKPFKVYFYRKLVINELTINKPSLVITYNRLRNKIKQKVDNRTVYERIKKTLKSVKLNALYLADVDFKYVDKSIPKPRITAVKNVNIRLKDILIDSLSQFDTTRIFTTKDIFASIDNYNFTTPDKLYDLSIKHLELSTQNKNLLVNGLQFLPRYNETDFPKQFKVQMERYKLFFDSIKLEKIDYFKLIDSRTLHANTLTIKKANVSVLLDRGYPVRMDDRGVNFPAIALKRVNWNLTVDTLSIQNTTVNYAEYNPKSGQKGTIVLNRINGKIYHVTNDSVLIEKRPMVNAYFSSYIMNKAKLDIQLQFNLKSTNGAFTYKGTVGEMEIAAINPVTKPLAMVIANNGIMHKLKFNIAGNLKGAGGTVSILYDNLNIILMKRGERKNYKRMGIVSLLANALLLERSNPRKKNEKPFIASVYGNRLPQSSFFNLMWKTVFLGLKENVGITKEKEESLKKRAEKFKDAREDREQRKLKRQQKNQQKN